MHTMDLCANPNDKEEQQSIGLGMSMDFGCAGLSDIAFGDSELALPASLSGCTRPSTLNAMLLLRSSSFGSF